MVFTIYSGKEQYRIHQTKKQLYFVQAKMENEHLAFFNAKEDIRADALKRREEMVAKSLFTPEEYEIYQKFRNPYTVYKHPYVYVSK